MIVPFLLAIVPALTSAVVTDWSCTNTTIRNVADNDAIIWTQTTCQSQSELFTVGPILFNIVKVDLGQASVRPTAAYANKTVPNQLQPLDQMATQNPNFVVGINGGYFFRTDISDFIDNVCWTKTRKDALSPVNISDPNYGIGDSMIKIDGEFFALNCDKVGYSKPTALVMNGTDSYIEILDRGQQVADDVANAISAGPNLVSFNSTTGTGYVNILKDDDNINIWEHAADTATGLTFADNTTYLYLVTVNGHDSCPDLQPLCGMGAHEMAHFMLDHLGVSQAMGMDQGGSTTMWIRDFGIVSNSDIPNPDASPRNLFGALFIELV